MYSRICVSLSAAAVGVLYLTLTVWAEPPSDVASQPKAKAKVAPVKPSDRVSVAVARERAKLMHEIYDTTLEVMHRHFFRSDRSVLPARAMEDVFAEMGRQSTAQARWIAVNTQAMSIHHEPETDFEKQAARELAGGKTDFELVEQGYYQRAGRIALGSGCVGCHTKLFSSPSGSSSPKFAGLVIRIPVIEE